MDVIEVAEGSVRAQVGEVAGLDAAVAGLVGLDLDLLEAEELLGLVGGVEVVARRLDAFRVRLAGALDRSGAYTADGHRSAKAALRHLGRLSGPEAARRVRTARALRDLPVVGAAFDEGRVPTELAHAMGRVASNRRIGAFLAGADPIFAEQAAVESHDDVVAWLAEWERLADADGADQGEEEAHRRRSVTLVQSQIDGSWLLRGQFGALQGAVLAETLAGFLAAEDEADRVEAVARVGPDATAAQWARSACQRRADALVALVRHACEGAPGRAGEPLVNIVIDQASFEEMIWRRTTPPGARRAQTATQTTIDPSNQHEPRTRDGCDPGGLGADGRFCATTSGHRLSPHDTLAAALVGHIRRVVIDGHGRVIDLGRTQRLFTGASKVAAELQGAIAARGPTRCLWSGCTASNQWLQIDHHTPWPQGGRTDQGNANLLCGHHNRLKTTGYTPVRGPDGTWQLLRPDGTTITPPV
jgi:Domain of unknown function (DUF222)